MKTTALLALLLIASGPVLAGSDPFGSGQTRLIEARAMDSAHTLFTPEAAYPGRAGQVVALPQGGFGVTTGGTANYQTLGMPGGGSSVLVPDGAGSSFAIGAGGRAGSVFTPR